MERLTKRLENGDAVYYLYGFGAFDEIEALGECVDRLASYEDTMSIERAQELAQAEKDGRLAVLPCKVGDTVYHITTCEHFPQALDGTMYGPYGEIGTATGYYCPYELAETCPFTDDFDCGRCKKRLAVFEDIIVSILVDDGEMRVAFDYSGSADVLDFGKTVFLTREEAEAALKKMGEADNETD